jgi:DNA modification methylase
MFGFQHNYCLVLYKGDSKKKKWNGTKKNHDKTFLTDVIKYQNGYRGKGKDFHPQAIPLDLTKKFIEILSDKGDLILDTFLGSGTTIIACNELNRNCIGIELKKEYIDMVQRRVERWEKK